MIQIADNFLYQGRKSLDSRIVKDTITDMVNMAESIIYDGIMVYNKETEKFYVFKSTNEVDPILKKWREFESGSTTSSLVTEYSQGAVIKRNTLIIQDGKLYIATLDFTADNTEATLEESLKKDIDSGKLIPVDSDKDTHSFEYTIGTDYKKGCLLVKDEKLYLVASNFTATDFDTELANKDIVSVDTDLDTHSVAYIQNAEYKKGNLIVFNDKLYIALNDFISDNTEATVEDSFNADLTAGKMSAVDIDTDTHTYEYVQNTKYSKGQLLSNENKVYLALQDFTSDNTQTTIKDSIQADLDANNITSIVNEASGNTTMLEYVSNTQYSKDTLVYLNDKFARVTSDYTSADEANDLSSWEEDVTNGNLILINSESGDAALSEQVVSNLTVGNIKSGDSFVVGTTFTEFVKKLLIKEILPTITLTAQDSGLRLLGTTVATPSISTTITLGAGTVQKVEFYRGETLEETQNYTDGTNTYGYNTSDINSNIKITAKVYYTESDGITTGIISKEVSYKFVNYSYSGVIGNIPTDSDVITLATNLKDTKAYTQTYVVDDEYIVYAYPASLGNLTSIKDQNNFEYINSFTKLTSTINNEAYNVYYLTDKITANGIVMKFS